MTEEYVSNPRLAILAEELRILNESMIAQNLHSTVRICRLRMYAKYIDANLLSARPNKSHLYDELPSGITLNGSGMFEARLALPLGKHRRVGRFEYIEDAIAAYQAAHIKQHGEQSPYYEEKHAA